MTSAFLQLSPIPKGIGLFIEGSAKLVIDVGAKSNRNSHPREVTLIEGRGVRTGRVCSARKIVFSYAVRLSASFGFRLRVRKIDLMWTDRYNHPARVGPRKYLGEHRMSTVALIDGTPASRFRSIPPGAAAETISRGISTGRGQVPLPAIDVTEGQQQ
jgi:hypothetical protein